METRIFHKEKEIIVTTVSLLLIVIAYSLYVYNKFVTINPEIINDLQFWGKHFFILIPIMVGGLIIVHIIFSIINKMITNEDPSSLTDEMDKLIELKAIRISRWVTNGLFLIAFATQAFGKPAWVLMATLIGSCFLGTLTEGLAKIYFYRKGV